MPSFWSRCDANERPARRKTLKFYMTLKMIALRKNDIFAQNSSNLLHSRLVENFHGISLIFFFTHYRFVNEIFVAAMFSCFVCAKFLTSISESSQWLFSVNNSSLLNCSVVFLQLFFVRKNTNHFVNCFISLAPARSGYLSDWCTSEHSLKNS